MEKEFMTKALAYAGKSQRKISLEWHENPTILNRKIQRGTLKSKDMEKIAKAIGAEYKEYFEFDDGTKIGIK